MHRSQLRAFSAACNGFVSLTCIRVVVLSIVVSLSVSGCGSSVTTTTLTTTRTATTTVTTTTARIPLWSCKTSLHFEEESLKAMDSKGMALDDTTWSGCADKITGIWPHTKSSPVKYLRLFAAWKSWFGGGDAKRLQQWQHLVDLCHAHNVKVFLGVDSTKDNAENEKQFNWALDLMKMLGKEHVIGFSFGNEMLNKKDLNNDWWRHFLDWCQQKVNVMDKVGFSEVPITVVWSMAVFPHITAKDNSYIQGMYGKYKERWVWTVNPYALWDPSQFPSGSADCHAKAMAAVRVDYVRTIMTKFRQAVTQATSNASARIWVGETGWSSPFSHSLRWLEGRCPEFCSPETLWRYYQGIMQWDGQLDGGLTAPEHIFYFSNRDAKDKKDYQPFGLIGGCGDQYCKMQQSNRSNSTIKSEILEIHV